MMEKFLQKARIAHGDKFKYESDYVDDETEIKIFCCNCGKQFGIKPRLHLKAARGGCKKCAAKAAVETRRKKLAAQVDEVKIENPAMIHREGFRARADDIIANSLASFPVVLIEMVLKYRAYVAEDFAFVSQYPRRIADDDKVIGTPIYDALLTMGSRKFLLENHLTATIRKFVNKVYIGDILHWYHGGDLALWISRKYTLEGPSDRLFGMIEGVTEVVSERHEACKFIRDEARVYITKKLKESKTNLKISREVEKEIAVEAAQDDIIKWGRRLNELC